MADILVLAVLGKFLLDVRPSLDTGTFMLAAGVLALAAGLGGRGLLRGPLGVAGLLIWIMQEMARSTDFLLTYGLLLTVLIGAFVVGRFVRVSAWAIPAAALLALLGLAWFGVQVAHP
jgi:hypothetical protein